MCAAKSRRVSRTLPREGAVTSAMHGTEWMTDGQMRSSKEDVPVYDCWYSFWLLAVVVLLIALANLTLTMVVVGVLRIGYGIQNLQIVGNSSVFAGSVDLGRVLKSDGELLGLDGEGFSLLGDGGAVDIITDSTRSFSNAAASHDGAGDGGDSGDNDGGARLSLSHDSITVHAGDAFISAVDSNRQQRRFFDTRFPNFGLPTGVRSVRVQEAHTGRVTSGIDRPLRFLSATQAHVRGSEGTVIHGRTVILSADQELYLRSVNGSVIISADRGVAMDVRNLPWTDGRTAGDSLYGIVTYILCVCAGDGLVFRVPVSRGDGSGGQSGVDRGRPSCAVDNSPCGR